LLIFREAARVPAQVSAEPLPVEPLPVAPPRSFCTIARLAIIRSAAMDPAASLAPVPVQESAICPAIPYVRLDPVKGAAASNSAPAAIIVRAGLVRAEVVSNFVPVTAIVQIDQAKVAVVSSFAPAMATVQVVLAKAAAASNCDLARIVPIVPATGRAVIGGRNIVPTR
jgi:hypothetical protein